MVAAAVRMRTPSAMFMSRGAASLRRPQVSYKFQEVIQYVCSQASRMKRATQLTPFFSFSQISIARPGLALPFLCLQVYDSHLTKG